MPTSRRELLKNLAGIACGLAASQLNAEQPNPLTAARKRLKIGQIGVAHAHANKLSVYLESADYEVVGFARRHFVVCGTGGTFHIQPLDQPVARIALSEPRDGYKTTTQEFKFPKFDRYKGDAADMAQVIRGEKAMDYDYAHDLAVQTSILQACGLKTG